MKIWMKMAIFETTDKNSVLERWAQSWQCPTSNIREKLKKSIGKFLFQSKI